MSKPMVAPVNMTPEQIRVFLHKHGHKVFCVKFRRRTDNPTTGAKAGDLRVMVCRLHVKRGVKGNDPDRRDRDVSNGIMTVYEMNGDKSGFKCVPLDSIVEMTLPEEIKP